MTENVKACSPWTLCWSSFKVSEEFLVSSPGGIKFYVNSLLSDKEKQPKINSKGGTGEGLMLPYKKDSHDKRGGWNGGYL